MDQSHGLRRRPLHDAVWHALIGDQEHGPMSRAQVLAYLRSGTLKGNDLVWRPGFEKWLLLHNALTLGFWFHGSAEGPLGIGALLLIALVLLSKRRC
jgi:hypothetical protein